MQAAFDRELGRLLDGLGGPLLLSVSGGADSMTMLHLALHSSLKPTFAVAHVNFSLREGDCDADEALVRCTCAEHGIAFHTRKFDTRSYASQHGISIEMAARELRYAYFDELMQACGYVRLLVAHNKGDNAETLLLNLLRGTGLKGLGGIREAGGRVLRPMLIFSRAEIERYAAQQCIPFREDYTNADPTIARNRIRHCVFPEFEKINPSYLETLSRDMEHFRQAQDVLDDLLAERRRSLCHREGDAECIALEPLRNDRHAGYWLYRLLEPYGFTPAQIAGLQASSGGRSGQEFLSRDFRMLPGRGFLKIYPLHRAEPALKVDTFPRPAGFDARQCPAGSLYADADALQLPLKIRPWRHGDRFRPLGMKGSRLVSDFFTDLKLDLEQKNRARIVYFEDSKGEHIVAVAPYRVDDRYRIGPSTGRIATISLSF